MTAWVISVLAIGIVLRDVLRPPRWDAGIDPSAFALPRQAPARAPWEGYS